MVKNKFNKDQLEELKNKRIKYEPIEIILNPEIKQVTSEEEYWKYHAIYLKKIKELNNIKKAIMYPDEHIKKFETIMAEMLAYGLVDIEWVNEQRQKIYKSLNYPSTLRNWVIKAIRKGKKKLLKK